MDGGKCRAHWNDDKEEGAGIKVGIVVRIPSKILPISLF